MDRKRSLEEARPKPRDQTRRVVQALLPHRPKHKISLQEWVEELEAAGVWDRLSTELGIAQPKYMFVHCGLHRNHNPDVSDMSSPAYWKHWYDLYEWDKLPEVEGFDTTQFDIRWEQRVEEDGLVWKFRLLGVFGAVNAETVSRKFRLEIGSVRLVADIPDGYHAAFLEYKRSVLLGEVWVYEFVVTLTERNKIRVIEK